MAKRQNFIVGSTNAVTETLTATQLNEAFNRYNILTADKLDGVFNAVSDFSNDSSNEIANAIQSITGAQPTGGSQSELANALQQMRNEIETTSLTFKGYVATSAPSSSTYALVEGNIWINSATMPTSFPVAASSIKQWNGSAWVNYSSTYTPKDFDFFRNINDNEGYYWFGGMWTVMSTDMSTTYFTLNQSTGKWEIKSNVNLPGAPTTTTPDSADQSTKIATTQYVHSFGERYITNCITQIPQDIQLETSGGTITLKSGSNTYVPNGSGTFEKRTYTQDKSVTLGAGLSGTFIVFAGANANSDIYAQRDNCFYSGDNPTISTTTVVWYDTTNNLIKFSADGGSTWSGQYSFPVAKVTVTNGTITDVEQVFNGIGYIGSTLFILPGVKALTPNGRNADGTLKNGIYNRTSVAVQTNPDTSTNKIFIVRDDNGTSQGNKWIESTTKPTFVENSNQYWYNPETNKVFYYRSSSNNGFVSAALIANFSVDGDKKITNFDPKQAFHAVDYNDFADLSNEVAETDNKILQILKVIYPVGSIYIGTQNTCPMSALFGTWQLVATGRALWGGNGTNGNTTIEAGLPNIKGTIGSRISTLETPSASGAFSVTYNQRDALNYDEDNTWTANFDFDASRSSSIYKDNVSTVQPPAYVVNVWRRTA